MKIDHENGLLGHLQQTTVSNLLDIEKNKFLVLHQSFDTEKQNKNTHTQKHKKVNMYIEWNQISQKKQKEMIALTILGLCAPEVCEES